MLSLLVLLSLAVSSCHGADPSPLQDYCIADLESGIHVNGYPCKDPANVTGDDFFYESFITDESESRPFDENGMRASGAHVDYFPALNTLGISMIQIDILPGGAMPPHVHPRATELVLLSKGKVIAGFVTTANVLYYKTMSPRMLCVIPQALVHFIYNVGNETATLYGSFNSQQPGTTQVPRAVFDTTPPIPTEVLTRSFRVNDSIIDILVANLSVPIFPANIASEKTSESVMLN